MSRAILPASLNGRDRRRASSSVVMPASASRSFTISLKSPGRDRCQQKAFTPPPNGVETSSSILLTVLIREYAGGGAKDGAREFTRGREEWCVVICGEWLSSGFRLGSFVGPLVGPEIGFQFLPQKAESNWARVSRASAFSYTMSL